MREFYGGDPLDYISDFRRNRGGYRLYLPNPFVEENQYDIDFSGAEIELMNGPRGDINGNMNYTIDFMYAALLPADGIFDNEEYLEVRHILQFHTASLMEDICRRYLQHPRFKFKTDLWLSAAQWRQFFAMPGEIGLIPVINKTEIRLGKSVQGSVLNEKGNLKF